MTTLPSPELIASFVEIVGSANALTAEADKARYLVESRGFIAARRRWYCVPARSTRSHAS